MGQTSPLCFWHFVFRSLSFLLHRSIVPLVNHFYFLYIYLSRCDQRVKILLKKEVKRNLRVEKILICWFHVSIRRCAADSCLLRIILFGLLEGRTRTSRRVNKSSFILWKRIEWCLILSLLILNGCKGFSFLWVFHLFSDFSISDRLRTTYGCLYWDKRLFRNNVISRYIISLSFLLHSTVPFVDFYFLHIYFL